MYNSVKDFWINGRYHAVSNHSTFFKLVVTSVLVSIVFCPSGDRILMIKRRMLISLLIFSFFFAVLYGLWHYEPFVRIIDSAKGTIPYIDLSRFYFLYPFIWYSLLGLSLDYIWNIPHCFDKRKLRKALTPIIHVVCIILCIFIFISVYKASFFKENFKRIKTGVTPYDNSFNSFFSTELFNEIRDYIGEPQSKYKVASIALYPSVPLFNGFYCIDGYSNNYDVEYKHSFRDIISVELEKNEKICNYFDSWGNRCYLFSSETGRKYYYTKNDEIILEDLDLNRDALKKHKCMYIISGIEIKNPEKTGLRFVKDFENNKSPYKIRLYKVM